MDAIWDHLELASGHKGVPGGVQKKGQNSKGLRSVLRGNGGMPGEGWGGKPSRLGGFGGEGCGWQALSRRLMA